jgi:hypothetical protein
MKSKIKVRLLVIFVFLAAIFIWWLKPTLRLQSENSIRASYLQRTPLNSTPQEVLEYIKKKWPQEKTDFVEVPASDRGPIGASYIGPIEIGTYWQHFPGLPAIGYVYVTWVFDDNDRLIDVRVRKGIDAV